MGKKKKDNHPFSIFVIETQSHSIPVCHSWLMDQMWNCYQGRAESRDVRLFSQHFHNLTNDKNQKLGHSAHYIWETTTRSLLNYAKFWMLTWRSCFSVHSHKLILLPSLSIRHSFLNLIFKLLFQWSQCVYTEETSPQTSIPLDNHIEIIDKGWKPKFMTK